MLSDRKRYNYMVGVHQKRISNENFHQFDPSETKKIRQLQAQNKRIIQDTTVQFQKFQSDLLRVQEIIEQKEKVINGLTREKSKQNQEKDILIEALQQKEMIIRQLEERLKEIINAQKQLQPHNEQNSTEFQVEKSDFTTQSEPIDEDGNDYKKMYQEMVEKALKLEDEAYKLKQQLFSANSELNLTKQQFSTFKLLKEIENVQNE